MTLQKVKNNKTIKILTNKYILILIAFIIWMLFFDENSYLTHREFNKEINNLQNTIKFYEAKISEDKKIIKKLNDSLQLEIFAREQYLMKKDNEDIYIIEFDTIQN